MNKEGTLGLIFCCTGIYGFVLSIQLAMGTWQVPGPGAFPACLSFLLCIWGVLRFIRAWGKSKGKPGTDRHLASKNLATPLKIVVVTLGFILSLDKAGYLVTSTLYMFVLLGWISRYKWWLAILLALGLGIGSWVFFGKILAVQLPKGAWDLW